MLPATGDDDCPGASVNAVLNEFGDGLQRIRLGKRDHADGVPIVTDPQFPFFGEVRLVCVPFHHSKKTS